MRHSTVGVISTKVFYSTPQVRFIELTYKHLLGHAPYDEAEIAYHVDLNTQKGYEVEINSYLDSPEYQTNFGEAIVPSYRGFATRQRQKNGRLQPDVQIYWGYANSARAQGKSKSAWLTKDLACNQATPLQTASFSRSLAGAAGDDRGQLYRVRVTQANQGRISRFGAA